jgi:hypothetical protein
MGLELRVQQLRGGGDDNPLTVAAEAKQRGPPFVPTYARSQRGAWHAFQTESGPLGSGHSPALELSVASLASIAASRKLHLPDPPHEELAPLGPRLFQRLAFVQGPWHCSGS